MPTKPDALLSVTVSRAGSVGDKHAPRLALFAKTPVPDPGPRYDAEEIQGLRDLYRADAKRIADALFECLPGGTIDQLLIEFLQRKASMFCVPFTTEKTDGE